MMKPSCVYPVIVTQLLKAGYRFMIFNPFKIEVDSFEKCILNNPNNTHSIAQSLRFVK